jgi:putative tributyrin esterase
MALFHVDFHSQVLQIATSMIVTIPEPSVGMNGQKSSVPDDPSVLYLLHGLSDDHTIWLRRTSVERYAAEHGVAVVMPDGGRSFYTDMAEGPRYWTFVSEELPHLVRRFFRLSADPSHTFVAGLSMGGYGAMKLALNYPGRFAAAATFSGAVDISARDERFHGRLESVDPGEREWAREHRRIFGNPMEIDATTRDLFHLASAYARRCEGAPPLPVYVSCGTEDFLYEQNVRFRDHLAKLGFDLEYREGPGKHEWGFWDTHVRLFLEWLAGRGLV